MIEYLALHLLGDMLPASATYKTHFFWGFILSNFILLFIFMAVYLLMKKLKRYRQEAARKKEEAMLLDTASNAFNMHLNSSTRQSEYRGSIPLERFFSNGSEEPPFSINSPEPAPVKARVTLDCTLRLLRIVTRFIIVVHVALFPVILYGFGHLNIVVSCLLFIPCIQFNLMQALYRMNK